MGILGLHHITLVCADAQRTVDFYTQVLGLHLVKKTVNFDDPHSYHLYFGDRTGRPGSAITFFEWRGAQRGHPGVGGTHHFALTIKTHEGLLKWKRRLTDLGLAVVGPLDRGHFSSILFSDPDGAIIEMATVGFKTSVEEGKEPATREDTWPEPVPHISSDMTLEHGMHHLTAISSDIHRTDVFYTEVLGMERKEFGSNHQEQGTTHWYWGMAEARAPGILSYVEREPQVVGRTEIGAGQTHHFALAVDDVDTQLKWRERLLRAGFQVTPVIDRAYFKSIYIHDPDGHIVELATLGPGFQIDEPLDELGLRLMLPPWLEPNRKEIEAALYPLQSPSLDEERVARTRENSREETQDALPHLK